jgi:hypothetical protein
VAEAGPADDSELIRLCERLVANDAANTALLRACRTVAEEELIEDRAAALQNEFGELRDRIEAMHAATWAGIVAKARAAAATDSNDIALSLAKDVLLAGRAPA